ncbi:nipped-B-like protein [Phytophthora infestans T30-4]|uniref:Sister chromatid cohesion protein n=1 Tax=Phytophthora infestans (strain T30-4) TaxID=403677 RepID=D0MYF0_PHYIT|nr:nipped-B-like protein [Phytophthora infestans T30-4]EEY66198.1 nipped-B-like protein [Phytophthora infestans T30-4]|eukprot:XP_002906797.1 nipped-B-like protein [Phytophthora infestans T30-4]
MIVIYPFYSYIFTKLSSVEQAWFSLVLLIIKLAIKNGISYYIRSNTDMQPEIVVFNVDVFNALFVSFSMQNSTSQLTVIVIITVDFIRMAGSIREVVHLVRELKRMEDHINVLKAVLKGNVQPLQNSRNALAPIAQKSLESRAPESSHRTSNRWKSSSGANAQSNLVFMERLYARKVLNLLHLTEFTILVEYIEVVVPVVYLLHHNELDRTLWGPASTTGRSRATDIVIFIQLAVVALLGVTCALDYDKPEAARLAAAGATLLMYFRSIGLLRILLAIFQSETLRPGQRKKRPMPSRMHAVPNKMRQKFLLPLYVDPEDAVAADAPESLYTVSPNPVALDESFNPQRLATLIRSTTTNSFGSLGEPTETSAEVLNSLPKWAQAVVQTGCFNAAGTMSSPGGKLKRGSGLQSEPSNGRPRKRRSFGHGVDHESLAGDESSELQAGLDELNIELEKDPDLEDDEELPIVFTQAEATADNFEKFAELLERLVETATNSQQAFDVESNDADVFQSEEVKMLRQSLKALEKNDWIKKLEPELLILLMSSFDAQRVSTLVVSLIQSCAAAGKLETTEPEIDVLQDLNVESSTPDTVADEKSMYRDNVVRAASEDTRNSARSFARVLLNACWKKSEERDNRVVLDNFVEDLLVMFVRPEWPGAEDLLEVLSSSLASILRANISADIKNPDSHHSLAALNLVGKICASIKQYQRKVAHSTVKDDSGSIAVIEEHTSNLREVLDIKKTSSRKEDTNVSNELLDQITLKHIVVMHLQRHNFGQGDSKKLFLLKFISESKSHWGEAKAAFVEREKKLWESLWEVPKGGVNSTFKVAPPTIELALTSSLHLAMKRGFCGLFNKLLAHIMALLSKGIPSLRARVMKCLRGIVDVDPMLMAENGVQLAVERCCSDEKSSVREAAVNLIGTYVLLQPVLFDSYFDVLAERLRDKGIKVRKSVCKIFKIAISMQDQSQEKITEKALHRKSACMRCLVERIGHAAEDQAVKNFIIDTFQEVWFGTDLTSSRLSNPLSVFCDDNTLPPGWTTVVHEKNGSASEEIAKFVFEDGSVANSVEEAWSAYRTPTVTPASVVKSNDSKLDNSSEVVATIVEVIHGVPNLGWFTELLKRLLGKRDRKTGTQSSKNRSYQVAIAEDRAEAIVDRLVGCLMDLQEGTFLKGVSIETAHEKDVKVQSLSVSMINNILSVKRVPHTIATKLEVCTLHTECLVSMKELLLSEIIRAEIGEATRTTNQSKTKVQQVQGDQEADASLIGNVMQAELVHILALSLQRVPQIRKEAIACIGALLTPGLVNPLQCIPNLVTLETDRVSDVRDAAFSLLLALEKYRSQFHAPLLKGIQDSYLFQLRVYGDATALGIDENKKAYCLFGRLYMNCVKSTKAQGTLFLRALVNQFTDQGTVLQPLKNKPFTSHSKTFTTSLKYLCYLAQILSTLPYEVEDEPLYIIYSINRYVSLRLGPVLDDLMEAFVEAGVPQNLLEDDEADLSNVKIDEYRLRPVADSQALQTNGCIAFAMALMLRLKFMLKRNYQLDDEKCATYKPSSTDASEEAKERSSKKLLLPSVDDLCQPDEAIQVNWNLFLVAWSAAREDQKQLDIDMEQVQKPKATPKRRRRPRKSISSKRQKQQENDSEDEDVELLA